MPVVPLSGPIPLTLDVIEEIAAQVVGNLEREALRTIRQKDTERGKACLDKIEGVHDFLETLRLRANSSYYRQLRAAEEARESTRERLRKLKGGSHA